MKIVFAVYCSSVMLMAGFDVDVVDMGVSIQGIHSLESPSCGLGVVLLDIWKLEHHFEL